MIRWWRERQARKRRQCRVDEEWCGLFIGRRYCSTHDVRWDGGGPCPIGQDRTFFGGGALVDRDGRPKWR